MKISIEKWVSKNETKFRLNLIQEWGLACYVISWSHIIDQLLNLYDHFFIYVTNLLRGTHSRDELIKQCVSVK
ncbi:hypothetical protein BpHYR1_012532 [Brachionus plicatilis]|uniref:Uncharacterized protein n=1 Tax=Brachionus plicatilis TaxID=10195 RepID=A0A3M7SCS0_BRAPC|nr:hypothetical protein BpHYR1_012532 [Brachionus plicatilis]